VLSLGEKTQIQALDRTQPLLPIEFDATEQRTHDYVRHGTTNLTLGICPVPPWFDLVSAGGQRYFELGIPLWSLSAPR
jgi:hypothetical protein